MVSSAELVRDEKIIDTDEWSVDEMWAFVRM